MKLAHLRLDGLTPYLRASSLQDTLVKRLLAFKNSKLDANEAPQPSVITAEFHPVYTCGRREINTVTDQAKEYLRATGAEFHEAMRGGQTTFHGPGQLVAYPIIDLKRHGISPRTYVCLLEKSVIATCARYGVKSFTTDNPGVWTSDDYKIAALGVHLRRNVTSHGIGLNVLTDLRWFERIVACGLEGKHATSLKEQKVTDLRVDEVADAFVEDFAKSIGLDEIYMLRQEDVDAD